MSVENNLDALRSRLTASEAALRQETKAQLAVDVAFRLGERVAVVEQQTASLDAKLDRVLVELGKLTERSWWDRLMMRVALLAVTAACGAVVAWFVEHLKDAP